MDFRIQGMMANRAGITDFVSRNTIGGGRNSHGKFDIDSAKSEIERMKNEFSEMKKDVNVDSFKQKGLEMFGMKDSAVKGEDMPQKEFGGRHIRGGRHRGDVENDFGRIKQLINDYENELNKQIGLDEEEGGLTL